MKAKTVAIVPWLLYVAYAALAVFATLHHEPWRDEAQAWLIARDLPLSGIIGQMRYEGSPALWHLILFPFAQLGAPYGSEAVIHVVLAVAAVGLLLLRGPFPLWFKALVAFSFFFSYEYAAVARSYVLSVLLLFALAAMHATRGQRPLAYGVLLALLANTNLHSVAMAAGLGLLGAVDARAASTRHRRRLGGLAIMALGLAAALWQLGTGEQNQAVRTGLHLDLSAPLKATRDAWLPGFHGAAALVPAAAMLLVALALWRWARQALWLLGCGCGGLYVIFTLKHGGTLRHHGLILVVTVFALWIAWEKLTVDAARPWRLALLGTLGALLAAALPFGVRAHLADARGSFSGAAAMAAYIEGAGLGDRLLAAYQSAQTSAVLPYLPGKQAWYADLQAPGTFITWDRRYVDNRNIGVVEAARRATLAPGWGPGSLLLLNAPLPSPERFGLKLLHAVDKEVFTNSGEQMYLYERVP